MKRKALLLGFLFLMCFFAMLSADAQTKAAPKVYESEGHKFEVEVLLDGRGVIWGFDFLNDGRILFTERQGVLSIFDPKTKKVSPVSGVPKVWDKGQGGLLDIRVHPTQAQRVYLTYSEPVKDGGTTAVAIARLEGQKLTHFKKILSAHSPSKNEIHFGSRIEFDGKGHIFVTIGERDERERVQDLGQHMGKILRLNEDGSVPKDNPYVRQKGALPQIWARGIRSPQGLSRHPETGEIWMGDMGPRGGDEINIVKKSANYGWPDITYGREYWGPKIGEGTSKSGVQNPVEYWVPSISPSGLAFYHGKAFPKWKNHLFIGTLSGQHLRHIVIKDDKVTKQTALLGGLNWRFRNVRPGDDGYLYISTDDGKIARLMPK